MPERVEHYDPAIADRFDTIIDVRSPAEFAEDHVPGSVNLPVLGDEERASVGVTYVQESRFRARRIGAALVARNIARHLEVALADKPGGWAPLIYCWRGGQRSGAMATVLEQVGWRATVLAGGYRTYRRHVTAALYAAPSPLSVVLLDGDTGSAKTEIIGRLNAHGVQSLDLEALAGHRGSLFGALPGRPQPSQKMFESRLLAALARLDAGRPVVVEAESSRIGERMVPPVLWKAMLTAPRIELRAPAQARARYLVAAYGEILAAPADLDAILAKLPTHHGKARISEWRALATAGDFQSLAAALIQDHYDPAYARSRRDDGRTPASTVDLASLQDGDQEEAAERIAGVVAELTNRAAFAD